MATTTNYGWTTPDDTALVKDGASAIRSLGTSADATVKTIADGRGLVHINTTTFSGSSSQSVNSVFSSNYRNYRLVIYVATASGGATLTLRLRAAGVDTTTGYDFQDFRATGTTIDGGRSTSQTSWSILPFSANGGSVSLDIFNPFETSNNNYYRATTSTYFNAVGVGIQDFAGANYAVTAFDGFTLIPSASTMTGIVSTFGYRTS